MATSRSSFDGHIPEIPGIAIDNFESHDRNAYFLSHCHTDHTQGLSSSVFLKHLEENETKIYMSDVTAAIIKGIPCYDGVRKYIKSLKLGSKTTIKLPGRYEDFYLEVTLIPAGHCLGSVMFLFGTPHSTILFTGDFRINMNDVQKMGQLHKNGEPITIDKMYVDTTFLDVAYDNLPKRSDSVDCTIKIVKDWLARGDEYRIALHTSARFGYEYVFNEIYKRLDFKTNVADNDWIIYRNIESSVPSVTLEPTRIHKCRNRNEHQTHTHCGQTNGKYLYVHLSAMKWDNYMLDCVPYEKTDGRYDICFPTHNSRSEIVHFVSYFSPKSVAGFPREYSAGDARGTDRVVFHPPRKRRR